MNYKVMPVLALILLATFGLSGCGEAAYYSVDPNVSGVQARATLDYVQAVQTSTAQAHFAVEWATTVQAASTQDARQVEQTQHAWNATATSDSLISTETAAANATAASWAGTVTQATWDRQGTAESAGLQALQTAQAAQAAMARMAVERQNTINSIQAAAPWVILTIAVPLVAYLVWLWGRVEVLRRRIISRDARGDAPILILDSGGQRSVVDPDLMFGAVVTIDSRGLASTPELVEAEHQAQVKARDQAVDLVNRGLPGPKPEKRALPLLPAPTDRQSHPTVRVVEPNEVSSWLDDVLPDVQRQALEKGDQDHD